MGRFFGSFMGCCEKHIFRNKERVPAQRSILQDRIREHYQSSAADVVETNSEQNGLESMSAKELPVRDTAIARGLPGAGTKEQLIQRLS
jgi:hypothetical protein